MFSEIINLNQNWLINQCNEECQITMMAIKSLENKD
jgi:hypothetical protein